MDNTSKEFQPWLKSMQNGGLGEARARAFLLERFWVLERSVDIQGADYLIQRRLTSQNLMDKTPPKLGVIQVKFIQDGSTYIKLNKSYVVDDNWNNYKEFFLLIYTGSEDNARSFLLSAEEISNNFKIIKENNGNEFYSIQGKKILENNKFEIIKKSVALERIDYSLKIANLSSNRRMLSSTDYVKLDPDFIDEVYNIPLDNGYGDIKSEFYDLKEKIQHTIFEIEEVAEALVDILNQTDPLEVRNIISRKLNDYFESSTNEYLVFSSKYFRDLNLFELAENHKNRIDALLKEGLKDNFLKLIDEYIEQVAKKTSELQLESTDRVKVSVRYNKLNLNLEALDVAILNEDIANNVELQSYLGFHEYIFTPYEWLSYDFRKSNLPIPTDSLELNDLYLKNHLSYKRHFQVELERHILGTDLAAPGLEYYDRIFK